MDAIGGCCARLPGGLLRSEEGVGDGGYGGRERERINDGNVVGGEKGV